VEAREAVRAAERIAILTGAGVSAESGIPTFREAQTGMWARFSPTELASPEAWAENPGRVWEWYAWRYRLCASAGPNAGHEAIAQLQAERGAAVTLVTQNVDSLHQAAGSERVIELHGNLSRARCEGCGARFPLPPAAEFRPPAVCPNCGRLARPDIVWFGEALPVKNLEAAWAAFLAADVALVVGTSGVVYPAADLPLTTRSRGGTVIEVNPSATPLTRYATHSLRGKAAELLPLLLAPAGSDA